MARHKKLPPAPDPIPFQYSPKVTLHPGDVFRCSGGPYYVTQDGKKILMGERGVYKFLNSAKDGIIATPYNARENAPPAGSVFIYMGEDKISEITGTTLRAHRIRKRRKKKKAA